MIGHADSKRRVPVLSKGVPAIDNVTAERRIIMKKTMSFITALVVMLVASPIFAAGTVDQKTGNALYNGITCFDLRTDSAMPEATVAVEPAEMPFNGVTYFAQRQPENPIRNYAISGSAAGGQRPEEKPYNGITVF